MKDIADKLGELGIEPMGGEVYEPLSKTEITKVEEVANARLPEDYKWFLATFGRSSFSRMVNCTPSGEPLYFGWFFGVSELVEAIENMKDTLPETIIPIGEDGGANLFCLGVAGGDIGKVYFHNHGVGWHADAERLLSEGRKVPADIRYQIVYQFASSFRKFIMNMVNEED